MYTILHKCRTFIHINVKLLYMQKIYKVLLLINIIVKYRNSIKIILFTDWAAEGVARMFSTIREGIGVTFCFGSWQRVHIPFVGESRHAIEADVRGSEGDNRTLERSESCSRLQWPYRPNWENLECAYEQFAVAGSTNISVESENTTDRSDASKL